MAQELVIAYYDSSDNTAKQAQWQALLAPLLGPFKMVGLGDAAAETAQIALVWSPPQERLAQLSQLQLIISLGQGVDHLLSRTNQHKSALPESAHIVRLVDPNMSHALSQWVILNILDHYREGRHYRAYRAEKSFIQRPQLETAGLPVAVYGMGAIGQFIASQLAMLGFDVHGWSRTKRDFGAQITAYHGRDGFHQMLSCCHCHVCILPLTAETEALFSAEIFGAMPAGSLFINGGRGKQVVEADLLAAIQSGHLGGAALDVFAVEPLPSSHPFWDEPKITLWPHVAAQTNPKTAAKQVAAAITAVLAGKVPDNRVDPERGY